MFSLESMSVSRFFDKKKFYFDSLVTGIMVSVWSITDIEYVIVEDTDKIQCINVDLDGYRWRNDDGVNLCRRILDRIKNNMNMDLRNLWN